MYRPRPVLRVPAPCFFQDNNHYSGSHSKASFTPSPGSKADPNSSKSKKKQQATQVTRPTTTPSFSAYPSLADAALHLSHPG